MKGTEPVTGIAIDEEREKQEKEEEEEEEEREQERRRNSGLPDLGPVHVVGAAEPTGGGTRVTRPWVVMPRPSGGGLSRDGWCLP